MGGDNSQASNFTTITQFEVLCQIGKGSLATVYKAKNKIDNKFYALKITNKQALINANENVHACQELLITQKMNHPQLIKLHGAFQTSQNVVLILDLMECDLFEVLKTQRANERSARLIAAQLLLAVGELQKNRIIMRDLKPENILVDKSGNLKLSDFGLSKLLASGQESATTFCGTPEFMAPEQIGNHRYSGAVDFWAVGCVVYQTIKGQPPFLAGSRRELYLKICNEEPDYTGLSIPCVAFLKRLLAKDPAKRLCSVGEARALDWFQEIDFNTVLSREYEMELVGRAGTSKEVQFEQDVFTSVIYKEEFGSFPVDSALTTGSSSVSAEQLDKMEDFEEVKVVKAPKRPKRVDPNEDYLM